MHSAKLDIHPQDEIPEVIVKSFGSFSTVEITSEKLTVQLFIDSEQQLTNFKNNFLWAFENSLNFK